MDECYRPAAMVRALCLLLFLEVACFAQALYTFRDYAFLGAVQPAPGTPANITNGLTAYWKLDEGSGVTAYDSTPNALNLTLSANALWGHNSYPHTNSIYLAIPPSYLSSSANALFATRTNDFSISLWFNKTNQWVGNEVLMISRDSVSANYHFEVDCGANLGMIVYGTNSTVALVGPPTSTLLKNAWHFLCISRIGTNYTLWLDGVLSGATSSTNITLVPGSPPTAYVGTFNPGAAFGGMIEEVMFRSGYGLTSNDVQYLLYTYYGGLQPISPVGGPNITNGLTLYLKMNEGSGITLHDSSTNGIDGFTTTPTFWTDHGHTHKYALAPGPNNYASSQQLQYTYQFMTNNLWSIGMWICHTGAAWTGEFLMATRVSGVPEWKSLVGAGYVELVFLPFTGFDQYLDGGDSSFYPQNQWVFIVITKNGNEYVPGAGQQHIWYRCVGGNVTTHTNFWVDSYNQAIGPRSQFVFGNQSGGYYLQGYMEEFRLHSNYCLSSNEVYYLYHTYYNEP